MFGESTHAMQERTCFRILADRSAMIIQIYDLNTLFNATVYSQVVDVFRGHSGNVCCTCTALWYWQSLLIWEYQIHLPDVAMLLINCFHQILTIPRHTRSCRVYEDPWISVGTLAMAMWEIKGVLYDGYLHFNLFQ